MEIERKYLVNEEILLSFLTNNGQEIRQGYFVSNESFAVRVRTKGIKGYLTIKGAGNGLSRDEFEYEIPFDEAIEMLHKFTQPFLHKTRYEVLFKGHTWEIDVFEGILKPLIVAEIELSHEEELFELPPFIGQEVTFDPTYLNSNIIKRLQS